MDRRPAHDRRFAMTLQVGIWLSLLLAVLAALCATLHFSRKALQLLFNSALAAVTTCLLVVTLRLCFGQLVALPRAHTYVFLLIICLTAALQAFFHSSVLALSRTDPPMAFDSTLKSMELLIIKAPLIVFPTQDVIPSSGSPITIRPPVRA